MISANAQKAADDLKSFAKRLQPLFEAAAALEELGSLEQRGREAQEQLELAGADRKRVEELLEAAKADLAKQEGALQQASQEAQAIVDMARADAKAIKDETEANAQKLLDDVAKEVESAKAQCEKDLADSKALAVELKTEVEVAQKHLEDLQAAIADMKAKVAGV